MCRIGRKRCSSRPSHDTLGFRSCSQVTWNISLCCHRWVALVLSWCLWCREEQDCHQICYVCLEQPLERVATCLSLITIGVSDMSHVGSRPLRQRKPVVALSIRLVGAWCGYCEGFFCRAASICPDAHPVPERFPVGQQHYSNRDAHAGENTRENPLHERIWSFCVAVKTALLGQFSPTGARRENCGLSEHRCRSPWIASLEQGIGVERAQTVLTATTIITATTTTTTTTTKTTTTTTTTEHMIELDHGA